MTKTILIASGKGGVGKTITSINLSLALNYLNHNVVLVDGNLQKPNICSHINYSGMTLHDAIDRRASIRDTIHNHPSGLGVVFGSKKIESFDNQNMNGFRMYMQALKQIGPQKDFVILDSGSNYHDEFFASAKSADEAIVVTTPSHDSLEDAKRTIQICEDEGVPVVGVVVNEQSPHLGKININMIQNALFKQVLGVVPFDRKMKKAVHLSHPVMCSYPNSKSSKAYRQIGKTFSDLNY